MNRPDPQHTATEPSETRLGTPRVSQALLRGTQEVTELFERRTASLKADYEERIRVLLQERSALESAARTQGSETISGELEDLRAERQTWHRQHAEWEQERVRWDQERAKWVEERATWEKEVRELAQQRDSIVEERERARSRCRDLETELADIKTGYSQMQELLNLKSASILALETRVKSLEGNRNNVLFHGGLEPDENQFNLLDFIKSPARSLTIPTLATNSSTLSSIKSPSLDPAPMQVRSPPLVPLPLDSLLNISPVFSYGDPFAQVDEHPSELPSSSLDLRLEEPQSPSTTIPTVDSQIGFISSHSPTSVARSRTYTSTTTTTPARRLVIRLPPSNGKSRKPLKPRPPQLTEEQRNLIIHVPRQPVSEDEDTHSVASAA